MDYFQEKLHKAGDRCIFYLTLAKSDLPFASNSYELVCSSYSALRYNSETNEYIKIDNNKNKEGIKEDQIIYGIENSYKESMSPM